ncbi:MAG: c-type cytochrome [Mariprofundaceae bacterium]|nr:c-type cytochrome [Mariprofundaceae bacterium]
MSEKRVQAPLKTGEKIMFIVAGAFVVLAAIAFVAMLFIQSGEEKPMFDMKTHFELSETGLRGSESFRLNGCTTCHRALRNGTNMGRTAELDGVGSRRSVTWLEDFLAKPEETYGAVTVDHGPSPKRADYVAKITPEIRHDIAVFLSELISEQGSSTARLPPDGRSDFIDAMVKTWAPADWKVKYHDVRQESKMQDSYTQVAKPEEEH